MFHSRGGCLSMAGEVIPHTEQSGKHFRVKGARGMESCCLQWAFMYLTLRIRVKDGDIMLILFL